MGDLFATTALSGSLLLAVPVALVAGLVSFASPCVLPLVPGYVGFVSGLAASNAAGSAAPKRPDGTVSRPPRGRVLAGVAFFVAGFTVVFVAIMAAAGAVGVYLVQWSGVIERVLGVVVIGLGLAFLGAIPALQRERRLHLTPRAGLAGAPLLGFVFGLGWTPCIGPTLAAVQALALTQGSVGRSVVLGVAYCLGLGLPFLAVGLGLQSSARMLAVLRRHRLVIMRCGGALLVVIGFALVTGLWGQCTRALQGWLGGFTVVL